MRGTWRLRAALAGLRGEAPLVPVTEEDRRYLTTLYDDSAPLPPEAERDLLAVSPRLRELTTSYARLELPVLERSRWRDAAVGEFLDLRYFRGESLFVWHYRELPRISQLKYYLYARYVQERDTLGLLERLEEDGQFGCWTFAYPGIGRVSRDLLQSINEISFLERELGISRWEELTVLDIGAGYGRLAHRMCSALPNVIDYCCTDAVAKATFISDWYLHYRGCCPPTRVVRLDRLQSDLAPGSFRLAVNMHSFSEIPLAAIAWWVSLLAHLEVPHLLVVPNEPDQLLSMEPDGRRQDFTGVLADAGFVPAKQEPVIADDATRELLPLQDCFHLFRMR